MKIGIMIQEQTSSHYLAVSIHYMTRLVLRNTKQIRREQPSRRLPPASELCH